MDLLGSFKRLNLSKGVKVSGSQPFVNKAKLFQEATSFVIIFTYLRNNAGSKWQWSNQQANSMSQTSFWTCIITLNK